MSVWTSQFLSLWQIYTQSLNVGFIYVIDLVTQYYLIYLVRGFKFTAYLTLLKLFPSFYNLILLFSAVPAFVNKPDCSSDILEDRNKSDRNKKEIICFITPCSLVLFDMIINFWKFFWDVIFLTLVGHE